MNINHNNFKQIEIEGMKTVFLIFYIFIRHYEESESKVIKPQPNYKIQK